MSVFRSIYMVLHFRFFNYPHFNMVLNYPLIGTCVYQEVKNVTFQEHFCTYLYIKNLANFTGKHLCWSLFLTKEIQTQAFPGEICKNFKNTFFHRTPPVAASLRMILNEAATGGVLWKDVFLKISQISRENACVWVSFFLRHLWDFLEHLFWRIYANDRFWWILFQIPRSKRTLTLLF